MSAPRDDSVYVAHIREAIHRVQSYIHGLTKEAFLETPLVQDAVIRQLQIIGEAAKRLSSDYRTCTSDIPWSDITGMREKLVHDYMGVDLEAVWETVTRDVPELRERLGEAEESQA
ncbi:MAG: DUF86 domain-containing protein [Candidatus Palauibacterales bacterium]|nr:DUF86 domain-containing protein [Candidatus Palauibacterales bacterium]MDP2530819.1 DUF86 domain-containing protein [Candidatus Palauibacterales bacterium]MDP2583532.1 DUF86 domain-containing protein [Candidatus Palauibacterales bacterium]